MDRTGNPQALVIRCNLIVENWNHSLKVLVLLVGVSTLSFGQGFRAGTALRKITPDPLLPVSGGMGSPHPSKEKKGDLFVRALVLENEGTRVALVSVDNLGWPSALGDKSRKMIKGIKPENVLIGATHTHSAPDAYGFPGANGKSSVDLQYLEDGVRKIAEAVNEASENMRPAVMRVGMDVARGKIAYNYYAEKLYDPRCSVMQFLEEGNPGKVIATLVNYAVHPEIIGSKRGILSPDLCGPLYERIEQQVGGMAIFFNGALGGMVTADNRAPAQGAEFNSWEECIRIGNLLADESLRMVQSAPAIRNPALKNMHSVVRFPVESETMKNVLKSSPVNLMGASSDSVSTRVNLLQVGPALMLTVPGEALPNIGYYLKRNLKTEYPFLLGLTNDAFGYIMTKEDFQSFQVYSYISRTTLGEPTYELYLDVVNKLIRKLETP